MSRFSPFFLALAAFFLSLSPSQAGNEWKIWKECRVIPNEYNDGDSFHIQHGGTEHIVRLYYVDTPETGTSNRGGKKQVAEQAAHFGKTPEEVTYAGRYAKQATAQLPSHQFTVLTKESGALGNSRIGKIYAFVTAADDDDLASVLVENGLSRSQGTAAAPPGKDTQEFRSTYVRLEARARSGKVGI